MQKKGRVLGVFVPLAAVVALIILLIFALARLAQIQHDMRSNVSVNMLWVITQSQVKNLRLSVALQRQRHEGGHAEQVSDAYRLLVSRFNLLSDGPQKRYLESLDEGHRLLDDIQEVRDVAATVSLTGPDSDITMTRMLDVLGALDSRLASIASRTMVAQWEEMGSRLDRYRNGVLTIIFLMLGICACAFIISFHMFMALRRVRESEWAKRQALQLQTQLDAERQVSELHRNFATMISHQFRTPLAIIDASMQRILRKGGQIDSAQLVRRVQKVRRATERLARLVEHSRIADQYSEILDVNLQSCNLVPLVGAAIEQQRDASPDRVIKFIAADKCTVANALCDPSLVEHIIFNFLSNAVKYSPSDKPVHVSVVQQDGSVCCEVKDWGLGIMKHDEPYVFDRYFRGQGVADTPGTGIGLYVAHKLAQIQGGAVGVAPNPDGGSIFKVCFPAADASQTSELGQEQDYATGSAA